MSATDLFPLDPDYPVRVRKLSGVIEQQAESGAILGRLKRPDLRVFELEFKQLSTDQMEQLRDWWERFKNDYFIFNHKVWVNNAGVFLPRKFPVRFFAPLEESLFTNNTYNGPIQLIEAAGKALQAVDYPDPALGHPSFFIEEDHASLAKAVAGTWTASGNGNAHLDNDKTNPNTNTTDKFRFTYAGYGFRLWVLKGANQGILKVLLDEIDLGNVDLYNATVQESAPLLTKLDVPLGLHRVDIKATNTKNASSTGNTIRADAVEVMP